MNQAPPTTATNELIEPVEQATTLLGQMGAQAVALLPQLVSATLIFLVFWLIATFIRRLIARLADHVDDDKRHAFNLIGKTLKALILIAGAVTALSAAGVNVTALVAGLGLTGFALGFALKDALSNLLAGVLILIYQPFQRGNRIKVAGFEGTVAAIDLRYTTLEAEGKTILVPNATLFTNAITILDTASTQPETNA